jgi:NAD-specific glutamate dehydrogenase
VVPVIRTLSTTRGGVDCSDLEVNTKIALNQLVAAEDLTMKQRNNLLVVMTEDVAAKVLRHNYRQTQAITLSMLRSQTNPSEYWQCILDWETAGFLSRSLEFLPDDDTLKERQKNREFLTRPEISVLLSYSKILFKQSLLATAISSDAYVRKEAYKALPSKLATDYPQIIDNHILHHEVLCNQLANEIVDIMGLPYVHRQMKSTGASADEIAKAYIMTRDLFDFMEVWQEVEALDHRVSTETQAAMQLSLMRLGRRSSRWLLRNRRCCSDTEHEIQQLKSILKALLDANIGNGDGDVVNAMEPEIPGLGDIQLSDHGRLLIDSASDLYFALGMADVCLRTESELEKVSEAYRLLGEALQLELFTAQIIALKSANQWEDFARESHMDDLENQFRALVIHLLEINDSDMPFDEVINQWEVDHESQISRWLEIVGEIHNSSEKNYAMVSVALRELNSLVEHD